MAEIKEKRVISPELKEKLSAFYADFVDHYLKKQENAA